MFSHIIDCPECNHRFTFEKEDSFPDTISCPSCGTAKPYYEYNTLILCGSCHRKLKVQIQYLEDDQIACPICNEYINKANLLSQDNGMYTYTGDNSAVPSNDKRLLNDGEFIDKFKIISFIGKGGMAEVYFAEHLLLKQKCAIKVMRSNSTDDQIYIKRFVREAKLAHSSDNPHIIRVFDAGCDFKTGHMFIAMDYIDGKNLIELAQGKPMNEETLLDILHSIATALKVLHENKIVHRDIKPSNIMRTKDGVYKLMDLGIAKSDTSTHAGEMTLTMDRQTIGTPAYASPEQCQSAHTADTRSDIYSLGATLYHLASGKIPYSGATTVEIILKVMKHDIVPLKNLRPDLSKNMLSMIESMMKINPAERPQSPDELLSFAKTQIARLGKSRGTAKFIKKITGTKNNSAGRDERPKKLEHITNEQAEKKNTLQTVFVYLLKFCISITLIAITALMIFYCYFEYTNPTDNIGKKLSFSDFVRYSFLKQKAVVKTKEVKKKALTSEEIFERKFSNGYYSELMTYPDPENKYSSTGEVVFPKDENSEPVVRWDFSKPETISAVPSIIDSSAHRYRWINETSKTWMDNCWDGALHVDPKLGDNVSDFDSPVFRSCKKYTVSVTFSTDNRSSLVMNWWDFAGPNIAIVKSQIIVIIEHMFVNTGIYVFPGKPASICCSVDRHKRLLTVFSENKFIGRYLLPDRDTSAQSLTVKFRNYYGDTFSGKIHLIEYWESVRNFQFVSKQNK